MWLMLLRTPAMASCKLRTHPNHPALGREKRFAVLVGTGKWGGGMEGGLYSQTAAGMEAPKATHGHV